MAISLCTLRYCKQVLRTERQANMLSENIRDFFWSWIQWFVLYGHGFVIYTF